MGETNPLWHNAFHKKTLARFLLNRKSRITYFRFTKQLRTGELDGNGR